MNYYTMTESREEIYIFNDRSAGSKLLQQELKDQYDIQLVNTVGEDICKWFSQIQPDKKVFLHFPYEDYSKDKEKLRSIIKGLESRGFRNKIVCYYEGMDSTTMEQRASFLYVGTKNIDEIKKFKEQLKPGYPVIIHDEDSPIDWSKDSASEGEYISYKVIKEKEDEKKTNNTSNKRKNRKV